MDKEAVRREVWDALSEHGEAAFPFPPEGRIPNFKGAADAAWVLTTTSWWDRARVVKCNPDAPQRHVRKRALEDGKTVVMAVPRLREKKCFWVLDPEEVDPGEASSIKGAAAQGMQVAPADVPEADLVVLGSVAVDRHGGRVGKGGGYADLEFALLAQAGRLSDVRVVTTVHPLQVREGLPMAPHDVPVDGFATPTSFTRTQGTHEPPRGIHPDLLTEKDLDAMPAVARVIPSRADPGGQDRAPT